MAYSALTFLLKNVDNQLYDNLKLSSDAQAELKNLADELGSIKAFLNSASYDKCNNEQLFKEWERQCRAVIYEIEDTIDSFITESTQHKIISFRHSHKKLRLKLAEEIKFLRETKLIPMKEMVYKTFPEVSIDQDAFDMSTKQARGAQRTKAPRQDNVVGFEDETETLIGYLLEESSGLEVVSIIGMPGLGKTTVAWKICQDPKIRHEFPILIWVVVSQRLNKKDVLLTILKKFTNQDMSSKSDEELVILVGDFLERSKFLIFMDDVWTIEVWYEIHALLPMHNKMGRVLITTRNTNVGYCVNHNRGPHRLRFLTNKESWMLLRMEVFGILEEFPPELEELGICIANKCQGLPLAIIKIGGILFSKLSIDGGNKVWNKKAWEMVSESLVNYLIDQDYAASMKEIISFSYSRLPHDLRDCFLHLGMFPEDTEIPVWKLIQLWIAEGFIQENSNGNSLEKIAQDYLDDLINRNLVVVAKTKLNGEVKTCRVHDTILAFCQIIAGRKDQDLFEIINRSREGVFLPRSEDMIKCRRICIHSSVEDFFLRKPKLPYARSFLCFSKSPILLEKKDIPSIADSFELLRIFDASNIKFSIFPVKFTILIHLRYLTLSGDDLMTLPEAMSKLWNLQTLIVNTLCSTLEIKVNIWDMLQLRHVKTKASIILKKGGEGKGGENLQTLTRLSPESCTNDVFNKAKNLKSLGIRGQLNMILDSDCLEKLERLEKLKLVNHVENPLQHFPLRLPLNIRILTLSNTNLEWMHMTPVGELSTLEVLKLIDNAFVGDSWDAVVGGFNQLEFLCISRTDLKFWRASGDSFPKLRSLILKDCEKLEEVPFELGKNLEMLSMERVTISADRSARKIEQAKKEMCGQQKIYNTTGGFKLKIFPGDDA